MSSGWTRRSVLAAGTGLAVAACDVGQRDVLVALAGAGNSPVNGVWIWMEAFARTLRGAGLNVEISANSALGNELDRTELTGLGLLHVNDSSAAELIAFSSAYRALSLPFLLDDIAHFERFIAMPDFHGWLSAELAPAGLVFCDAALLGGMSGLFTARMPVTRVDDLRRLRLRAMGRMDLLTIEALGASGVQVAWEEVPQALQTGIAEGYINPPLAPVLFGHGSQINHFLDLNMTVAHRPVVLSARWLEALSSEQRVAVNSAVTAGRRANRDWARDGRDREMTALAEIGVTVTAPDPALRAAFAARARAAYPSMAPAATAERLMGLAGEARR